jgi:hypothetical protein
MAFFGALSFGAVVGWYLYFINRYRKSDVSLGDITTVIGAIGGAAVLKLYGTNEDLFGGYGIGLGVGFFGYYISLLILVTRSTVFTSDWFLDGRRPDPIKDWGYGADNQQTVRPQAIDGPPASNGTIQNFYFAPGPQPQSAPSTRIEAVASNSNPAVGPVEAACLELWPPNRTSAAAFVTAVAGRFGAVLHGTADNIIEQLKGPGWTLLMDARAALQAVRQGQIVVVGLTAADFSTPPKDGQLAVLVDLEGDDTGILHGYWGSVDPATAAKGGSGISLSQCFPEKDFGKLVYAYAHPAHVSL